MKLSGLPDLSVASICGPRVPRGMRAFEPYQSWMIPGHFLEGPSGISFRQRSSFSPDAVPSYVVVVLLAWNFAAGSFHARKGVV